MIISFFDYRIWNYKSNINEECLNVFVNFLQSFITETEHYTIVLSTVILYYSSYINCSNDTLRYRETSNIFFFSTWLLAFLRLPDGSRKVPSVVRNHPNVYLQRTSCDPRHSYGNWLSVITDPSFRWLSGLFDLSAVITSWIGRTREDPEHN